MRAGLAAKPKDLRDYYAALDTYAAQGVTHEGAVRSAFQHLLAETGRRAGWTLIPELPLGAIRPDGTFRDEYFLNRGLLGSQGHQRPARSRNREEKRQRLSADQHDL